MKYYLIFHNGAGLKIFDFEELEHLKSYIRSYPPLQYTIVYGEYVESNL